MRSYKLTARAKTDLKDIGRYTQHAWGKDQRDNYLYQLEQRFKWLAVQPEVGRPRHEIATGYYSFTHQQHSIFYLPGRDGIEIIGIVHHKLSAERYFSD